MKIVSSMLQQLGINQSIFVMLGVFVLTYFVFHLLVLRRLSATLIERDERTAGREHEFEKLAEILEKTRTSVQTSVQQARAQANGEFLKIKAKAVDEQKAIVQGARSKAAAELQSTREQVSSEFQSELGKLEGEVTQISQTMLDKVIRAQTSSGVSGAALSASGAE